MENIFTRIRFCNSPPSAELAKGKMRAKIADLSMALEGRFGDHHALMCRLHLDHIDHLQAMTDRLDAQIETMKKGGGYRSSTVKKKAIIVVAHAMIVIILARPGHRKALPRTRAQISGKSCALGVKCRAAGRSGR